MKHLTTYFQLIAILATSVIVFGFVLPHAFSSKNDVDVLTGFVVMIIATPAIITTTRLTIINRKKEPTNEA